MESKDKAITKKDDFGITEQNWLMLKAIEKGKSVKESYKMAGYKGEDNNAPYQLYHRLKKKMEMVYDADNVDSLRLKIAAKAVLDMQVEDKPIKPETKLKAIETLHKLQDGERKEARVISPFIIFKDTDGKFQASKGEVVEAKVIEGEDNG